MTNVTNVTEAVEVTNKEDILPQPPPQNVGDKLKNETDPNKKPQRRNIRGKNSTNTGDQARIRIARQSGKIVREGERKKFTSVNVVIQIHSYNLSKLIEAEIEIWMTAATEIIPLIQLTSREPELRNLVPDFFAELTGNTVKFSTQISESINIVLENDADLKSRTECVSVGEPTEFKFIFYNSFFWSFIDMLKEVDKQLIKIEELDLCGMKTDDLEQCRKELISITQNTFKSLMYVSKIRCRRDTLKKITRDTFLKVQKNYRERISTYGIEV